MKKKLLAWLLACSLLIGCIPAAYAADPSGFTDMPDDWSRPALTFAVENNLLNGNGGKINPSGTLTRAHMAAILVRAFGAKEKADLSRFSDVSAGAWYYNEMAAAVAMGIFQGSADGKLRPNTPITRQQAFAVLARAFLLEDGDPSALSRFSDGGGVSEVFRSAVAAMTAAGYVNGNGGRLNPGATITRAQFAQVLYNMIARFGIPEQPVKGSVILRENQALPAGTVIQGDLIVAEGAAVESLNLSDVTIQGRVVVRGGSEIKLSGSTSVGSLVLSSKSASVQVSNNSANKISVTAAGGSNVTLTGGYSTIRMSGEAAKAVLQGGSVELVDMRAPNTVFTVKASASVETAVIQPGADHARVIVEEGGKVHLVETSAKQTEVSGDGQVEAVQIKNGAEDPRITTDNTEVTVEEGANLPDTKTPLGQGPGKTSNGNRTHGSSSSRPSGGGSSGGGSSTPTPARHTVIAANGQTIGTFYQGTALTIDLNGGGSGYTVIVPNPIVTPAREGYTFSGWQISGTTLTAQWTKVTVPAENIPVRDSAGRTIGTFRTGDVLTVNYDNGTAAETITVAEDTVITVPAREGYTFKEWSVSGTAVTALWTQTIQPAAGPDKIYDGTQAAPIVMDASYPEGREHAYTQVARAVGDLRQDIAMVNGAIDYKAVQQLFDDDSEKQAARLAAADQNKVPQLVTDAASLKADYAIIVGTYQDSKLIQNLVAAGKLSGADVLTKTDAWESYTIQEVDNPTANIKKALVIAGADPRGTIFGIYTISEEIGVSPWYWYSDVPVKTKSTIDVDYTTALKVDSPDVKYRGIFINDEEYSNLWARDKFTKLEPELGGDESKQPGVNYYRHLFEVILRMKGNTLWPAMHTRSKPFFGNKNADGVSINGIEAGRYGIVMGSSHCEILLRNSNTEWDPWIKEYNSRPGVSNTNTSYNFCTNEPAMLQYWRERLIEARDNGVEGVMVLGLRGKHDGAAAFQNKNYYGVAYAGSNENQKRASMMKEVIQKQRALIKEVYGSEDAVAQVYVAYDDLGERYNDGVNQLLASPEYDDIIVMWANDSYGNLRQTPNRDEQTRPGGSGIYYHTSYMGWGGDRKSYLFLNSLPIQHMNEQMHRAYDCGMQAYWILNVGDLKPGDILAQYFLEMGWDMSDGGHPAEGIHDFLADWCVKQYAMEKADAEAVAAAMEEFYDLTNVKKAEFYGAQNSDPPFNGAMAYPFSVTSLGDEGQRAVERANQMVDAMTAAYEKMDPDTKAAFFEQMYFHAQAYRDIAEEYVYYWKNLEYAKQGRTSSAAAYKELSRQALAHLLEKVDEYGALNGGKWNKFISPVHYYPSNWGGGQNQGIVMLDGSRYQSTAAGTGVGAFAEGNAQAGTGTLRFNSLSDDTRYIDVFSKSGTLENWTIEKPGWVAISDSNGREITGGSVSTEQRLLVKISDWTQAVEDGSITVKNTDGSQAASFTVKAVNKGDFDYGGHRGYVEANGYVMIEAEHYSKNTQGTDGSQWKLVFDRGPRGDCMKVSDNLPELGENTGNGARLTYDVYFENAGTYPLTFYRIFTLNEGSYNGNTNACRTMLSVNGSNVGLIKGSAKARDGSWFKSIHTSYEPLTANITVNQGWNTIELTRSSPSIVFDNILIVTDKDAVLDSLNGPEISPNSIMTRYEYEEARQGIAGIPEAVSSMKVLPDVALGSYGTREITVPEGTVVSAVSADVRAAKVEVTADGRILVTAGKFGSSGVTVTLADGSAMSFTVKVTYQKPDKAGCYLAQDGRLVIDALDALEQSEYASFKNKQDGKTYTWTQTGYGMKCTPQETDKAWTTDGGPSLSYKIYVDSGNAGSYKAFFNVSAPSQKHATFFVQLDGGTLTNSGHPAYQENVWFDMQKNNAGYTLNLTEGEHILTIYARQSGFQMNQIYLTREGTIPDAGVWLDPSSRGEQRNAVTLNDFENLVLTNDGASKKVTVTAGTVLGGNTVSVTAESSDNSVAAAAYQDGTLTVTAGSMTGTAKITVTASAEGLADVQKTFTVTVNDASEAANVYGPNSDGNIIINTADAAQNKPYATLTDGSANGSTYRWVEVGENGRKCMQVQKDGDTPTSLEDHTNITTGTPWNASDTWTSAPQMTYKVYVPTAGKYYLSVYSYSWNDQSNSFHLILNGQHQFRAGKDTGKFTNEKDQWGSIVGDEWFYGQVQLDLKAGENTITIAGRKSGYVLRQIMLSPAQQTNLTGWQTACEAADAETTASLFGEIPSEDVIPGTDEGFTPENSFEPQIPGEGNVIPPEDPGKSGDFIGNENAGENGNPGQENPSVPETSAEDRNPDRNDAVLPEDPAGTGALPQENASDPEAPGEA